MASAQGTSRAGLLCPAVQAGAVYPFPTVISISNSRVYYLDGNSTIRYVAPDGSTGVATTIAVGSKVVAAFTVSPDDRRIAVSLIDFSAMPISVRLYVEDLKAGTNHRDIFSSASRDHVVWPVGWHAGHLVLAVMVTCSQGGGPFGDVAGYHVVDALTAARIVAIPPAGCYISSKPSPAGITCTTGTTLNALDWSGRVIKSVPQPANVDVIALSPDGTWMAGCCGSKGEMIIFDPEAKQTTKPEGFYPGWIDNDHLVLIVALQSGLPAETSILVLSSGRMTPLSVAGYFAGRLPVGD
ncbi:MAG: hypothetical protein E6J20_00205 [Chloroflexi bacterium]|nr:MAG: hypothetical protein E6J20_00205 [Chloroflexota bacterium]